MKILTSMYGLKFGRTADDRAMCGKGFVAGEHGSQFHLASPDRVSLFDDFDNAIIDNVWGLEKGSDGGAVNYAVNAGLSGRVRGTTGAGATTTMAVNGVQLDAQLNFQANSGGVEMQARVKLAAITTVAIFVGFTNQAGSLQMPINGSGTGNGLTNNANDAVGVLFDTTMTTPDWWLVGVQGTVGAVAQDAGSGPAAATYDIWRIELDTSGNATFYRGNNSLVCVQVGAKMASAVTASVPLTPVIAAFRRSAASTTIDVDYLYASTMRV